MTILMRHPVAQAPLQQLTISDNRAFKIEPPTDRGFAGVRVAPYLTGEI